MIDYFHRMGILGVANRLRMLADRLTADAWEINDLYGVTIQPRWMPVFLTLTGQKRMSVSDIARQVGYTHPAVIGILKELRQAGLAETFTDDDDRRKTYVRLTAQGHRMEQGVERLNHDVEAALEKLCQSTDDDLWKALEQWEDQLMCQPFRYRVVQEKEIRERNGLKIVSYDDVRHHDAFIRLNERSLRDYFTLRADDLEEIARLQETIIDQGGYIYMAEYNGRPVGTLGLVRCRKPQYDWELVCFAVDPGIQGVGIGNRLMAVILHKARQMGADQIYLETNLFNQGFRPAINVGISVSRVGGSAQIKSMKKVAGTLKIDMAQYRELEAFSKFSSDMDPVTAMTIDRGRKNNQLLIQPQYSPMPVGEQVAILYCGVHGLMHDVPVDKVRSCQDQFLEQMRTSHKDIIDHLAAGQLLEEDTKAIEEVMGNIAGQFK